MLFDEEEWKSKFNEALKAQQENKYELAEHTWYVAVEEAEIFGPQDVRLAKTLDKLTEFLLYRGKLEEASKHGYRCLSIYEGALGENADELASILANLAMLAKINNNMPEAEKLYRRALAVNSRVLGPSEPKVKQLLTEFANVLDQLGRGDEADQLRGTKKKKNPEHHQDPGFKTIPSMKALNFRPMPHQPKEIEPSQQSGVFRAMNHLMTHQKDGVKVYTNEPNQPVVAPPQLKTPVSEQNTGTILDFNKVREQAEALAKAGDLKGAKTLWQQFIDASTDESKLTPNYCYALESMANLFNRENKFTEVILFLEQSLDIKSEVLGPQHPVVGSVSSDLAKAYYSLHQFDKAEVLAVNCLNIYAEAHGEESIEVANACHNLGTLYHIQKKYDQAKKFYEKSLPIKEKVLGSSNKETIRLRNALQNCLSLVEKEIAKEKKEDKSSEISGAWRVVDIPESKPGWWKDDIFGEQ